MRRGTKRVLRMETPFVPFASTATERARPPRERRGERSGRRESSPASMAAQGMRAKREKAVCAAPAPLPKSASSAPRYPPYFFPRKRQSEEKRQNKNADKRTGAKYSADGKKRTSSAPEINPAPIAPPTINSAPRSVPIKVLYVSAYKNMKKYGFFSKIMSDIVLQLLTKSADYGIIRKTKEEKSWTMSQAPM